jgi:hypothetical protein
MIPLWGTHLNNEGYARRVVCKRCHSVLDDCEPHGANAQYFHKTTFGDGTPNACPNAGDEFSDGDKEVEPFMRKRDRRAVKRGRKL